MSLGALHIHEHGGEACNGAGAEIGEALRIRADDAHAGFCGASTMRRSLAFPATASPSPKPDAITTATLTPCAAQSSTALMALSPATATITISGDSGRSSRLL